MKKRILSIMLAFGMLAAFIPCIAGAEWYGDWSYEVNEDGTGVFVDHYIGDNAVVPSDIDGMPVTGVSLAYDDTLKSVTIPDSVTSIGEDAFRLCASLKSITIPDSVTSIGANAFKYCYSLTSITIPDSVTSIGANAFEDCTSLTSAAISNSVTEIGICTFVGCKSLTSVTIPGSVTSIGSNAFYGCTSLKSVTIPNSVTSIGPFAFSYCRSLASITIPDSVTKIDNSAFGYCTSLTSVTIPGSVTSIGESAFDRCESLTNVTIQDGVTSINQFAFVGCTSLTSITIPASVTSIDEFVFSGCTSLTSITIPASVTKIANRVFAYCDSLTDIYYDGSEEQWKQINADNDYTGVTVHCGGASSAQPTETPSQPAPAPQTGSYSDVPSNHWAYDNVKRITELGGFNGYEDGTFRPDNQITHEEFLKVVTALAYRGDVTAAPASSIGTSWEDWAKPTFNAAVDMGLITSADTDLTVRETPITRAEMAKIISRTLDYLGKAHAATPDTSKIPDWNSISADYQPYVADVYSKGIITGYNDGSFAPSNSLTRAEASTVIVRIIDAQ